MQKQAFGLVNQILTSILCLEFGSVVVFRVFRDCQKEIKELKQKDPSIKAFI